MRFVPLLVMLPSLWPAAHDPLVVIGPQPVAIEAESVAIGDGWVLEREIDGYQGEGYLRWAAPNAYSTPGSGELCYRLLITEGGRYQVRLRLNTRGAERSDLGNDAFTRFDDGPWAKTFVGGGSSDGWATRTRLEPKSHEFADAVYDLAPGLHTFAISGRSHGLRLDRFVMWRDGEKQPADTIPPSSGVPTIPAEINDPAVRDTWRLGGLGAVRSWAAKRAKDPQGLVAIEVLEQHADGRLAEITAWRERDPLTALDLLENLAAQYQTSERGRELSKLLRTRAAEPAMVQERKARAMSAEINRLLGERARDTDVTRQESMATAIRDGVVVMRRSYAGTRTLEATEQRVTQAGIALP